VSAQRAGAPRPGAEDAPALLEARALVKGYPGGVAPLLAADLVVRPGEWVAVTGPSGSGKTTLLNLLGGLDRPTAGVVRVLGRDLAAFSRRELLEFRRERVGLVFQQFHLLPYLTALENVMLAQHYHSLADAGSARAALARVGLEARAHHRPAALSAGERQRVCIARALVNEPRLLLADEPTGSLDPVNARVVMGLFGALHRRGHSLLVVTHDEAFAGMADRVVRLEGGRLQPARRDPEERARLGEEILHEIWAHAEKRLPPTLEAMGLAHLALARGALEDVVAEGLVEVSGERLRLTTAGRAPARRAVRRHRVVERLFSDTFRMAGEEVHDLAERFHALVPHPALDGLCGFLRHPATCPHGHVIPPGECCGDRAAREALLPQFA